MIIKFQGSFYNKQGESEAAASSFKYSWIDESCQFRIGHGTSSCNANSRAVVYSGLYQLSSNWNYSLSRKLWFVVSIIILQFYCLIEPSPLFPLILLYPSIPTFTIILCDSYKFCAPAISTVYIDSQMLLWSQNLSVFCVNCCFLCAVFFRCLFTIC